LITIHLILPATSHGAKFASALSPSAYFEDQSNQETKYIACDGAFLMIGATPNTDWLSNTLLLDMYGLIRLDKHEENLAPAGMVTATSLPGVFAAGEVGDAQYKQAITAAAEGAQAALDAERWLRNQQPNTIDINKEDERQAPVEDQKLVEQGIRQEKDPRDDSDDDCDLARQECIDQIIHKYPVVVFSKPYCPYCRMALEALAIEGLPNPHIVDLSEHSNARVIQSTLASMTGGRRTVPNVFVGGTSIGGGDETVRLQATGKLKPLLVQAGAIKMRQSQEQIQDKDAIDLGPPSNGDYGCDLGTEDCITKIVDQYPLVLFSLSWCPECHRMSELLATVGIHQPHIIDLDDYKKDGTNLKIRQSLVKKAKSNQVPSLFVGGEALGRYSSVLQLNQSGQLVPKLQAAGLI
jgi:glutaredoxin 3